MPFDMIPATPLVAWVTPSSSAYVLIRSAANEATIADCVAALDRTEVRRAPPPRQHQLPE